TSYEDVKVYTFNRGSSTPAVANTTISAGLPFITGGGIISVSSQIREEPLQWGIAKTIATSVAVTSQVTVPPKSTVVVRYVGTEGTCTIPYTYTQQDRMSNGQTVISQHTDGIYNGTSLYGFAFRKDEAQTL
uniref:hypothetical protein n=1 Tax=Paraclostridium dentum TaxID=2662455 RepID=UPI00197CF244